MKNSKVHRSYYYRFKVHGYTRNEVIAFVRYKLTSDSRWLNRAIVVLSTDKRIPGVNRLDKCAFSKFMLDIEFQKNNPNEPEGKWIYLARELVQKYTKQLISIMDLRKLKKCMDDYMDACMYESQFDYYQVVPDPS